MIELTTKLFPVILAGGLGTRLRSVYDKGPKVLAPVNGKPFLFYLFDQLLSVGFTKVMVCIGYKGEQIQSICGEKYRELDIYYSVEEKLLGTGGALRQSMSFLNTQYLLVLNGDSYVDFDLKNYIQWFFETNKVVGLVVVYKNNVSRYGKIYINKDGLVINFLEKQNKTGGGWINAGIYIIENTVINLFSQGIKFSLEKNVFPLLVDKNMYGYKCFENFIDIGVPKSYKSANSFMKNILHE